MSRSTSTAKHGRKNPFKKIHSKLLVEKLEDRSLPSCTSISGFVYYDANNNGLFDSGENPIANSQIELRDTSNVVIGTTTTDATGHYVFDVDKAHPGTDATLTKTVDLPTSPTQTNYSLKGMLDQFDSSLGVLQSVEITYGGSITSTIDAENFSPKADPKISGTVSGDLSLIAPGVNDTQTISAAGGDASDVPAYDGITDYTGASAAHLGEHTATGSKTVTVTGNDLNAYIGSGKVELTTGTIATSHADGGGNLDTRIRSTGISTITVVYHYKAYDCIAPGDYKIIQTKEPDGYTDGKESQDGTVIPNTIGTDFINVHLTDHADSVNNNFGELKSTQISGHVWYDANNDGVRDASEDPIAGVKITLATAAGPMQTTTDSSGFYQFTNLTPGTYTVTETQPTDYLDGKDNAGTINGTVTGTVVEDPAADQIQTITLQAGDDSINNDFGELKPASLAGHVWYDKNNDGVRDPGEAPIPGTTVTLTGFDDNGPVSKSMVTNAAGEYKFANLRPGVYALTETQPVGYTDGKDKIGTPGGTQGNDVFSDINLKAGVDGVNNDFGEIKADTPPGPGSPLPKGIDPLQANLPIVSKVQLTAIPEPVAIDPGLRGQMAFVVGTTMTLTGQQLNNVQTLDIVQQLQNGLPQSSYVQQLWTSDAHRVMQANELYQDLFNRAPTSQEQASAISLLNSGVTEQAFKEQLLLSSEYQQLHPNAATLAQGLFRDILNKVPDTQSSQALLQSMANDPLQEVVHTMLTSTESLTNVIDDAYRQTVRRPATAAEIQAWLGPLQSGQVSADDITVRLMASQEFYQLAYNSIH